MVLVRIKGNNTIITRRTDGLVSFVAIGALLHTKS